MQITLRLDDTLYREAKAEAARRGLTVTRFIEDALRAQLDHRVGNQSDREREAEFRERIRLMELLLQRTAHFRIGPKPTREEMNERSFRQQPPAIPKAVTRHRTPRR